MICGRTCGPRSTVARITNDRVIAIRIILWSLYDIRTIDTIFVMLFLDCFLVSVGLSANYFDHNLRHVTIVKLLRKRLNPHVFQCARTIHVSVLWNKLLYYDISQKENLERLFHTKRKKKKTRKYHNFVFKILKIFIIEDLNEHID